MVQNVQLFSCFNRNLTYYSFYRYVCNSHRKENRSSFPCIHGSQKAYFPSQKRSQFPFITLSTYPHKGERGNVPPSRSKTYFDCKQLDYTTEDLQNREFVTPGSSRGIKLYIYSLQANALMYFFSLARSHRRKKIVVKHRVFRSFRYFYFLFSAVFLKSCPIKCCFIFFFYLCSALKQGNTVSKSGTNVEVYTKFIMLTFFAFFNMSRKSVSIYE